MFSRRFTLCPALAVWLALCGSTAGCGDPEPTYEDWPDPLTAYPWVYTPEQDLEDYEEVRWETETWEITDAEGGFYYRKWFYHRPGAPEESLEHFAKMRKKLPALGQGLVLSFVGDIMWIGADWDTFAIPATEAVAADLRVGNLETPASPLHEVETFGLPTHFNASPEILDNLPFDVLQLNNNHTLDVDDDGLEATLAEVDARGITRTGVDSHALVDVAGAKVALLAYTWGSNRRDITSAHELFVVPFGHIGEEIDLSPIAADIEAARGQGADYIVVLAHWGFEYEYYPDPHFLQLARQIIALGADVIAGHGPHVVQPAEICYVNHPEEVPGIGTCSVRTDDDIPRRAAVLYSLGDFSIEPDLIQLEMGLVAKVSLDGDVTGVGWTPTVIRHEPESVEPVADHLDDQTVADELARLQEHLGATWMLPP